MRSLLLLIACALASACHADAPKQYLVDWELEADGQHESVHLPAHLGLRLAHHSATYHLRTRVVLDDVLRGREVTFGVPFIPAYIQLAANGHDVPYIDDHFLDRVRVMTAHRFRIAASDTASGVVDLEITVHSDIVESTFWDTVPRLSAEPFGDKWTRFVHAWNTGSAWISLVALLTFALVFLSLALAENFHGTSGRLDRKNFELAKLAGGSALFCAVQIGFLQPVLGRHDMGFVFLSSLITTKASVQLIRGYAGVKLLPSWTTIVVCALAPLTPFLAWGFVSANGLIPVALLLFAGLAHLVAVRVSPTCRHPPELNWFLVGWLVVICTAAPDFICAVGGGALLGGLQLTGAGLLGFVNLKAVMLGREHTVLTAAQAELNRELERRVVETEARAREIESLNAELRRRVGDRSRELSTALRKLRQGGAGGLAIGTVLGDRYRVIAALGAGAMGSVFRVERISDNVHLALKILSGRMRPDALERLAREAEMAARIDHPNVVRVLDVDVSSDGELFLVMELVNGCSLEDERKRFGELSFALPVLLQIANALVAIHEGGVVHRDLKPANVLVSVEKTGAIPGEQPGEIITAKVTDFGVAGVGTSQQRAHVLVARGGDLDDPAALEATIDAPTSQSSSKLTHDGAIVGTPLYMSPEVLAGVGNVGAPADVYSFGLIAYQLLGGLRIQRAPEGLRRALLQPWDEIAPGVSSELLSVLRRCVKEDPTRRPTARALADALSGKRAREAV
jgi:serine/threonine-protein kinase